MFHSLIGRFSSVWRFLDGKISWVSGWVTPNDISGLRRPKNFKFGTKVTSTLLQKNQCYFVFDDNLNSRRPIVIIFGTVIS